MKMVSLGLFLLALGFIYVAAWFGSRAPVGEEKFWFRVFISASWFCVLVGVVLVVTWFEVF